MRSWLNPAKAGWAQLALPNLQTKQKPKEKSPWVCYQRCSDQNSAQADLAEDALAGQQFGGQADYETKHGQAAIPGFCESHEAEAGFRSSHGIRLRSVN